jgi:hypothetical protein
MKEKKVRRSSPGYCSSLFAHFFYDFDTESRCPYADEDHEITILLERKEMERQDLDQRW